MAIEFSVEAARPGRPFPHYWELCVGSCHAVMGLRQDWREQLAKVRRELGFRYLRFHGLLDDAMSVCVRDTNLFAGEAEGAGPLRYSFLNVDSVFDFLLSIGMKPFVELGFMPEALASGKKTCFHYKANITPPADYGEWEGLVRSLTEHLVGRYGLEEVRSWFFEVWNEPNLAYFWAGSREEYFELYAASARAIKGVDQGLRVGGPATSINAWLPEMIDYCRGAGAPLDFLSTHHYPTDDPLWRSADMTVEDFFKKFSHLMGKYKRGVLREMTARARAEAGELPLYYTEWNCSAVVPDPLHDEPYAAAFVAKTIADNDGLVEGYSFWTFSDLFEERGQYAAPFHGGFGLQTVHGVPKPTYRVFEFLRRMGDERLEVSGGAGSTVELLATRAGKGLALLAYNHASPEERIGDEVVKINLRGLAAGKALRVERVDSRHANPKAAWEGLGRPEYPTAAELAELMRAAAPAIETARTAAAEGGSLIELAIPAHGVAAIFIDAAGARGARQGA